MKNSALAQVMVVVRKELKDWSRDRRSIITAMVGAFFAPLFFAFTFNTIASRQRQVEEVTVPIVGIEHAPALMDWLEQQPGVAIVAGPGDPEQAVRDRTEDLVVVIPKDFAERFRASKPARVRMVADSSSQSTRPKVQRVRQLFQRYSSEIGSLRLIARGVSPVVASPLVIEDVEVSSAQQRAATILSFLPVFIMMAAFMGAMQIATDSTAGERERGSLEALLVNPAPRGALVTGKWLAGVVTAMVAVLISGTMLVYVFRSIPFQDLGLRFSIGLPQLGAALAVLLPLCPLIVAVQMYFATFAKSFKEAQGYMSVLLMFQMLPGFITTLYPLGNKTWLYFIPSIGQQTILSDILGGKDISPLFFVAMAVINVALAVAAIKATTGLLQRERIIFGR